MSNPTGWRAASRVAAVVVAAAVMCGTACRRSQPLAPQPPPGAAEQKVLLEELRALPIRTDPRDRAAYDLRGRFEALYRTRPATAEGAPEIVRDERELRGKIILDALARAETVQSAAALLAIANDDTTPMGARRYALECLRSSRRIARR